MSEEAVVNELNELIREFESEDLPRIDPKLEVNSEIVSKVLHLTRNAAYRKLIEMERKGELVSRWVRRPNGSKEKAWRKKEVALPD